MLNYRFRLYPTEEQKKMLDATIETCRHLYNDSLDERSKNWDIGFWEQKRLLTLRKQDNKYYKQVHSQVLQDVLLRLDKAYQGFFKKLAKYPKFKKKGKCNSFSYSQYGGFRFREVFEKLNINNMVKNHNLAQAIMDATWGKLRQYTAYKVERRSGQVILVNPSGTSQKCSRCGVVAEEKLGLDVRTFECHSCGLVIDRDLNAAINILKLGLEQTRAEAAPLLIRRISKFSRGSKKPTF
jgi:transposase